MRVFLLRPLLLLCAASLWSQQYTISTIAGGAPTPTPAPAISAYLPLPAGIAADRAGNVFFTSANCVFKLDSSGTLTRIAGDSRAGFLGDGGPAVQAELNNPEGLAIDAQGNLYVADFGNNRVRRIRATGIIETVAGEGGAGSFGDGVPATQALLNQPQAVAIDPTGNLYIADSRNGLVREVTVDGNIHTVASQLIFPQGLAIGPDGSLFIAQSAGIIKRLRTDGTISTFISLPKQSCDPGSIVITPQGSLPEQMTFDSAGNLLIPDSWVGVVDRVSPTGQLSTIAGFCGSSASNQLGDGGLATRGGLRSPNAVTMDPAGNLYIADLGNHRIRKITPDGVISTAAGGVASFSGDGGPATAALLSGGVYIAADPAGNIYQADTGGRVRKISLNGTISTIAGTGVLGFSGDGGAAVNAQFSSATAVAADGAGNVYVADASNQRIRKISASGVITTVAGNGTQGFSGDGGPATAAQLNSPSLVAVDGAGNIWINDYFNGRVRKVSAAGIITTIAGNGKGGYSGDGGPVVDGGPATAGALQVTSMAVDRAGNVYLGDRQANSVRKVATSGIITTVAGNGQIGSGGDFGPATAAQLGFPAGLAVDASGSLFIYDSRNNSVRKVTPDGVIVTVAGNGVAGYSGDSGLAIYAQIDGQSTSSLAGDGQGNVYLMDRNNAIRVLTPGTISSSLTLTNGASNRVGPVSPGEIVVVYGAGLGPDKLVYGAPGDASVFGTQVAGVLVLFNGIPAPVTYAWSKQVAAIAPYALTGSATARVQVLYQGQTVFDQTAQMAASNPALFTANASGTGQAAAANQDGTPNSAASPAPQGSAIVLFATGEGQTSPAGRDGRLAGAPLAHPKQDVSVTIAGQPATVEYAGGAPGEIAGLIQINVRIPYTLTSLGSALPVVVTIGRKDSQAGVTIAVK